MDKVHKLCLLCEIRQYDSLLKFTCLTVEKIDVN